MDLYQELIAQEEKSLNRLEIEMRSCRMRLETLRRLRESFVQPNLITEVVPVGGALREWIKKAGVVGIEGSEVDDRPRKNSIAGEALPFIGGDGKTLDEIFDFLHGKGRETTRGTLRTLLMSWRKQRNWIDNPYPGFYKLTERGVRLVKRLEEEEL